MYFLWKEIKPEGGFLVYKGEYVVLINNLNWKTFPSKNGKNAKNAKNAEKAKRAEKSKKSKKAFKTKVYYIL